MTGSELASAVYPADKSNYTKGRTADVTEIIIHHMAASASAKACGMEFSRPNRGGSAHYGIGKDGETAQYVSEADTAWDSPHCKTGISVECANSEAGGDWKIGRETEISLTLLAADIAERNGLYPLSAGDNLTWHSMYDATECPGDYLRSRIPAIASAANCIIESHRAGGGSASAEWSRKAVDWAIAAGIIKGDGKGDLMLKKECTREEMTVMLYRFSSLGK